MQSLQSAKASTDEFTHSVPRLDNSTSDIMSTDTLSISLSTPQDRVDLFSLSSDVHSHSNIWPVDPPGSSAGYLDTVSMDTQSGRMAPSPVSTENSLTSDKPTKGKKRKGVCAFFQRAWKAIKCPFLHFHQYRVEPLVLRPQLTDSELTVVICASDLEQMADAKPANPEPSSVPASSGFEPTDGSVESHYIVGDLLGSGSFGMVFEGIRKSDGKKVAIKRTRKFVDDLYLIIPDYSKPLLAEVGLMLMAKQPSISPHVIELYEWFDEPNRFTLIMEYTQSCESLMDFISDCKKISEPAARVLMHQAVLAAQYCIGHGIFHRDMHSGNFLVNKNSLELKLIDFGCGEMVINDGYNSIQYRGAPEHCPPEVHTEPKYHAVPATVWSLGVMLFEMLTGHMPFKKKEEILLADPKFPNSYLSRGERIAVLRRQEETLINTTSLHNLRHKQLYLKRGSVTCSIILSRFNPEILYILSFMHLKE